MGGLARKGISISSTQHRVAIRGQAITGMAVQGQTIWTRPLGGWSFIATASAAAVGTITPAIDTTGADFLIAAVAYFSDTIVAADINDSFGNTWNALPAQAGSPRVTLLWSRPTSVGPGHTFQALPATGPWYPGLVVAAASGSASAPLDQFVVGGPTTVSITPSASNTAVLTALCAVSTPAGVTSPFILIGASTYINGIAMGCGLGGFVQETQATVAATWTALQPNPVVAASFFENPIRLLPT